MSYSSSSHYKAQNLPIFRDETQQLARLLQAVSRRWQQSSPGRQPISDPLSSCSLRQPYWIGWIKSSACSFRLLQKPCEETSRSQQETDFASDTSLYALSYCQPTGNESRGYCLGNSGMQESVEL